MHPTEFIEDGYGHPASPRRLPYDPSSSSILAQKAPLANIEPYISSKRNPTALFPTKAHRDALLPSDVDCDFIYLASPHNCLQQSHAIVKLTREATLPTSNSFFPGDHHTEWLSDERVAYTWYRSSGGSIPCEVITITKGKT